MDMFELMGGKDLLNYMVGAYEFSQYRQGETEVWACKYKDSEGRSRNLEVIYHTLFKLILVESSPTIFSVDFWLNKGKETHIGETTELIELVEKTINMRINP